MTSKITKKAFHVPPPSRQEVSMQNHTGKNAFRFSLSILAAAILATTSVTAFAADVAAGTGPGLSVGANSSTAKANQIAIGSGAAATMYSSSIICQNNFRHSFSLTWSGKTCDIRRSL